MDPVRGCLLGQVAVESTDQPLAHHVVRRRDLIAIAINEAGV